MTISRSILVALFCVISAGFITVDASSQDSDPAIKQTPVILAEAESQSDSGPLTKSQAIQLCDKIDNDADMQVSCWIDYIYGVPQMFLEFRNDEEMKNFLEVFAKDLIVPFCSAVSSENRPTFVFAFMQGRGALPYSCEDNIWGKSWLELPDNKDN